MAPQRSTAELEDVRMALAQDFHRRAVQVLRQEILEAEMAETLQAKKGERTEYRLGYRSGSYGRTLITRVGKLELRAPQDCPA